MTCPRTPCAQLRPSSCSLSWCIRYQERSPIPILAEPDSHSAPRSSFPCPRKTPSTSFPPPHQSREPVSSSHPCLAPSGMSMTCQKPICSLRIPSSPHDSYLLIRSSPCLHRAQSKTRTLFLPGSASAAHSALPHPQTRPPSGFHQSAPLTTLRAEFHAQRVPIGTAPRSQNSILSHGTQ